MLRTLRTIALGLLPSAALAGHPLATDDAATQGEGRSQLELTAARGWDRPAPASVDDSAQAAASLARGLDDRVDLVIGVPTAWGRSRVDGAVVASSAGVADAGVALKWRVLEAGGFRAAVKPALTFPIGDARRGLGTGRPGYGLTLIASQAAGPVTVHANAGYAWADFARPEDAAGTRHGTWTVSLAAAAQVAPALQLVADVGTASPAARGAGAWPAYGILGAVWTAGASLDLDVGVRGGLNDAETDFAFLAGAAWRF